MVAALIILFVAVLIAFLELPALLKKKQRRDIAAFLTLLVIGSALSIAKALHVSIPTPLEAMSVMFEPFGSWLFRLLE